MSIEKRYCRMYFAKCDKCQEKLPPVNNYNDAVDTMNINGWSKMFRYGEWENLCPTCQRAKYESNHI